MIENQHEIKPTLGKGSDKLHLKYRYAQYFELVLIRTSFYGPISLDSSNFVIITLVLTPLHCI